MLSLAHYVPRCIVDYLRLVQVRRKYPGRNVQSHLIKSSVALGEKVVIGKNVVMGENVSVGSYSYVNDGTRISSGTVGKFCSISYNCLIGGLEHPAVYISTSPFTYGNWNLFAVEPFWDECQNPPVIGNDVWIGANSIIKQGVTIGDGAIVGAGSIVTKDVPPYSIVVGAPVKVIKTRFPDKEIKELLQLRWWDLPKKEFLKLKHQFLKKENGAFEITKYETL